MILQPASLVPSTSIACPSVTEVKTSRRSRWRRPRRHCPAVAVSLAVLVSPAAGSTEGGHELGDVDLPGQNERGAEGVGLRDADVGRLLEAEDALADFGETRGSLFRAAMFSTAQVARTTTTGALRKLALHVQPFAGGGKFPFRSEQIPNSLSDVSAEDMDEHAQASVSRVSV